MITVLRLGHRLGRDPRITTHIALTARAFGASRVVVSTKDPALERRVRAVVTRFGGPFAIETGVSWKRFVERWSGPVVHLTMYGEALDDVLPRIPRDEDLLLVVGATKVPRDVYDLASFNVAVGSQPHSEVAALAVFLDRYHRGAELRRSFSGRIEVVPTKRGKSIVERPTRGRGEALSEPHKSS